MIDFLNDALDCKVENIIEGENDCFNWIRRGVGIIECIPKVKYDKSIMLSAGIHGNETAPIEILNMICQDLFNNKIELRQRILLILGNPFAMKSGVRYLKNDMNRMFCGKYHHLSQDQETYRAAELEKIVVDFFENSIIKTKRYHYDLHTAIRTSLFPTFALLPFQLQAYDEYMLESLNASELDAIVYHSENGATFTHFSSSCCQASSVTLELGKAKPFGQNNLQDFYPIHQVLLNLIANQPLPVRQKSAVQNFKVVGSILKLNDDFKLNLTDAAPNFTEFAPKEIIYSQGGHNIWYDYSTHLLFPNLKVKKGLRAGLVLIKKT
ncbi:succinylglutamate desuccinylase [Acinetobacter soli]|uniref:succinylglutamate desuccinylase n=1 Tax=Acinetobacter soli TaxID=487316 RepID=UPI0032B622DE